MSGDDTSRLIYLSLLGGAVVLWFLAQNRNSLGKVTQQAMIWGLIFVGVIAAVGLWDDIRQSVSPQQSLNAEGQLILPKHPDGHYYLRADVNGQSILFLVDTGATQIVISQQDADTAGIDLDNLAYVGRANTANGVVKTAPVRLDSIIVDDIRDYGVAAVVNEGQLEKSLLGMSYLQRYQSIEIRDNALILTR